MPTVSIEGLEVRFPYDPYEIQKNLMGCVIKCIQNREHGLLESPTGTGKTASLLCASLAWQQNEKDLVRKTLQGVANAAAQSIRGRGTEDPTAFLAVGRVPKIIYATRTHSQIAQAMRELKRTAYSRVKAVTLGSRDMLCIHEEVSRLPESSTKIMACHMKVLGRTCAYYNNVQKVREQFTVGDRPALDIEDLVSKGKVQRFCPFFMSKELVGDADLIFMPYNYLLDPKLRASHGVDLKGCIIILDEAHNITSVCESSSSFELKSSIIAQCIREVTRALNEFNELTEELKKSSKDLSLGEIVKLKAVMLELEKQLDEASFCLDIPDSGKTVEGQEVLKCFFASGFTIDQLGRWIRVLDGISSFLASNFTEATGCDKFSGVLRVLSTKLLYGNPNLFLSSYAVRVEVETTKSQGQSSLTSTFGKPKGKLFNFWCLNPAVGLDLLLQQSPRCIMLASGTLSPIDFLENELQLHFPVKIQNPHIITDKQLYAAVLKLGPGNVKLSSAFNNRGKTEYLVSLGGVIRETCSIVPEGVLVFFPSYAAMDQAVDYWKDNGHWGTIAGEKSAYVEPRGKRALDDLIANYYADASRGSGSCLMAVCRGKVSEGLDFTDGKCRAVIITGLPYAPFKNEQVTSKMKYLDGKAKNSQGIRGSVWYGIDAVRALNQAVGRIIRHQNDYGAIMLCDDRCDQRDVNQNLSGWVSSRLMRPTFSEMTNQLRVFFKSYGVSVTSTTTYTPHRGLRLKESSEDSSFEFMSQRRKGGTVNRIVQEVSLFKDEPGLDFSALYHMNDEEADSLSKPAPKKTSIFETLEATTSPTVSFTTLRANSSKSVHVKPSISKLKKDVVSLGSSASCSNGTSDNPKKKIKLISENCKPTQYSRIAHFPKAGATQHHISNTISRLDYQKPTTSRTPVFKPIFSSTQSPVKVKAVSSKSFENVKEFGEWMKETLDKDKYQQVMEAFKNYRKKNEVMKLLDLGKKIFTKSYDYRSYVNGLRLVTTFTDRTIINDVISTFEEVDD